MHVMSLFLEDLPRRFVSGPSHPTNQSDAPDFSVQLLDNASIFVYGVHIPWKEAYWGGWILAMSSLCLSQHHFLLTIIHPFNGSQVHSRITSHLPFPYRG